MKKTIAAFEGLCGKKGITFDLTTSSRELIVTADIGKIQQVLYNLIDNAIKFSRQDSSIAISTTDRYGKVFGLRQGFRRRYPQRKPGEDL